MRAIMKAGGALLVTGALAVAAAQSFPFAASAPRPGVDWPQFRGIKADGTSDAHATADRWNVASNDGIAWKTPIPGLGLSSPIVWGDLACLTTSISGMKDAGLKVGLYGDIKPVQDDTEHEWRVYCLDKKTGAVKWQQTAHKGVPKIKRHTKATHANSTLATDGERLIAFFGSEGLYAYDMSGKLLWKSDLGVLDAGFFMVPEAQWETGSSPVIHDNVVVVQADVQKDSFLGAFDARDRQGSLAHGARRRADMGHADHPHGERSDADHRQRLAARRAPTISRPARRSGRSTAAATFPCRLPSCSDGLIYITNAHGARWRPSMPSAKRPPATSASRRVRPPTKASRGAIRVTAATCARRSSTAAWSTS